MKTIDLAVIIPTLNEEHFIGKLLDSLHAQTVHPQEIVVVDACSSDNTAGEVKKRIEDFSSLAFFAIPKDTIARQRNFGASKTSAAHVLFLDADMQLLEKDTLKQLWGKIQQKHPDVATCYIMPLSDELKDKLLSLAGNTLATVLQPIKPIGTTMILYVKRSVFASLQGFDEKVRIAEDFEFISRVKKAHYIFKVFRRPLFYTSIRRFEKEGRLKYLSKVLLAGMHIGLRGYHKNPVPYEFGQFTEDSDN